MTKKHSVQVISGMQRHEIFTHGTEEWLCNMWSLAHYIHRELFQSIMK